MTQLRDTSLAPFTATNPLPTRTPIRPIVGTFAAAAASDYLDNDVISNDAGAGLGDPIIFAGVALVAGGAAKIIGASLSCSEDGIAPATSELFLFSQAPTTATEMDDNAAWGGVAAAEQPYFLGSIAFPALVDVGAGSFVAATSPTPGSPLLVNCVATSLFGILVARDAITGETAAMTVTITLYAE